MEIFELTGADKMSPVWMKLKRYFEARIEKCRKDNDSPLDAEKTAALRGRIEELKKTLKLESAANAPDK
jgi:hypothetical protein